RDDPQREEREEDREDTQEGRQQRGDEGAEEQQREQEDDREREQLRPREVVADLRVDLLVRYRAAAELDVTLAGEPALQALGVGLDSQIRLRLEVRDDVGRTPVTGDHGRVAALVVAG